MGLIRIQPSRKPGRHIEIRQMTPTASVTLAIGEPVQRNSSDPELIEAFAGGATVTGLVGFAMAPVTAGTPGFGTTIPVAIANVDTEFLAQVWDVSGGAVATAAVGTHEGNDFGLVEPTAGYWYVDEEDTTNVHVFVTKVITEINAVLFKVISTVLAN